jgi:hypothetical protein
MIDAETAKAITEAAQKIAGAIAGVASALILLAVATCFG